MNQSDGFSIVRLLIFQSNKEDLVAKAEQEAEEEENRRKIKEERAEKEKAERFAKISDWKVSCTCL